MKLKTLFTLLVTFVLLLSSGYAVEVSSEVETVNSVVEESVSVESTENRLEFQKVESINKNLGETNESGTNNSRNDAGNTTNNSSSQTDSSRRSSTTDDSSTNEEKSGIVQKIEFKESTESTKTGDDNQNLIEEKKLEFIKIGSGNQNTGGTTDSVSRNSRNSLTGNNTNSSGSDLDSSRRGSSQTGSLARSGSAIVGEIEFRSNTKEYQLCFNNPDLDITSQECDVLLLIYSGTNGDNWSNNTNWFLSNNACEWYGISCINGKITSIDLSSNNLEGAINAHLEYLESLEYLNLSNNKLTSFASPLSRMTGLKHLDLSNNNLGMIFSMNDWDKGFINMPYLVYLDLSNNNLGGLHYSFGNLSSLVEADLSNNPLLGSGKSDLSTTMRKFGGLNLSSLQNLEVLNLSNIGLKHFPANVIVMNKLRVLDISNNNLVRLSITNDKGEMLSMGDILSLREIDVSGNQLTGNIEDILNFQLKAKLERVYGLEDFIILPEGFDACEANIWELIILEVFGVEYVACDDGNGSGNNGGGENLILDNLEWCSEKSNIGLNGDQNINFTLTEYGALAVFFDETNGYEWTNNDGWFQDFDLCNRYGISCIEIDDYLGYNNIKVVSEIHLVNNNLSGTYTSELINGFEYLSGINLNQNPNLTGWTDTTDGGNNGGTETPSAPRSSGGGGGSRLVMDYCPNGDFSPSYYDNTCDGDYIPSTGTTSQTGSGIDFDQDAFFAYLRSTGTNTVEKVDPEEFLTYNNNEYPSDVDFQDIQGKVYEEAVKNLARHGFVHGYNNDGKTYAGENNLKRGEMYKVFVRMAMLDVNVANNMTNTGDHWSKGYELVARSAGLLDYMSEKDAEEDVNELDLAQMTLNYMRKMGIRNRTYNLDALVQANILNNNDRKISRGSFAVFVDNYVLEHVSTR